MLLSVMGDAFILSSPFFRCGTYSRIVQLSAGGLLRISLSIELKEKCPFTCLRSRATIGIIV